MILSSVTRNLFFLTAGASQVESASSSNYKVICGVVIIVVILGLVVVFGAPAVPPTAPFVVENIANNFDVIGNVPLAPLVQPIAVMAVSALVEGFDDGTFAPSGAVVPLNGNPDAFLTPDSPLPATVAHYELLNLHEPVLGLDFVLFGSLICLVLIFILVCYSRKVTDCSMLVFLILLWCSFAFLLFLTACCSFVVAKLLIFVSGCNLLL